MPPTALSVIAVDRFLGRLIHFVVLSGLVAGSMAGRAAYGSCPSITLTPVQLGPVIVGVPYSQALTAVGGSPPYQYTLASGSLPVGLLLNAATGVVSGTPISAGAVTFTARVQDSEGCTGSRSFILTTGTATENEAQPAAAPGSPAELVVTDPAGGLVAEPNGAFDFGSIATGASGALRTFVLRNTGADVLADIEVTVSGEHADDFILATAGTAGFLDADMETTVQITFSPQDTEARTATLTITSSDPAGPVSITLTGTGLSDGTAPIQILEHPVSQILSVGGSATLRAAAQGNAGLKYQWQRNNANVAGATGPELTLTGLKINQAGGYRCVITSAVNGKPATAATNVAQIGLVNTAPVSLVVAAGAKTTFTALAGGNNISFQWQAGAEILEGQTGKSLVLTSPQVGDTGTYACRISAPGGSLVSGVFDLTVYDQAPEFLSQEGDSLPPAVVSGAYDYTVPVNTASNRAPAAFTASGLPPGLVINKTTGAITGKPTASKAVPYEVTVSAANARGKATAKLKLTVAPLPANLIGTYTAVLSRFADLNGDLGGRLDFTVTSRGTLTGKLILGDVVHPFADALDADVGNPLVATASVTITRKNKSTLSLALTLDAESNWLNLGRLEDGGAVLEFSGWRNVWTKAAPASGLAGYYTFGLAIPDELVGDGGVPQGSGYGSFTVAANTGLLKATGKLPDGTSYTISTFAGPGGEIALFQTLYAAAARGSLVGNCFIGAAEPATDNTFYGSLSWWSPGSQAPNARLYRGGFGPFDLTATGAVYQPPAAPAVALGLTASTTANAVLDFAGPVTDMPAPEPDLPVIVGAKSKLTLPTGAANPRKTTLALNTTTGIFSGRFTMSDADLLASGKTAVRTGDYSGIIVRDPAAGSQAGQGCFLLPRRPAATGEKPSNTSIEAGTVSLTAAGG